MVDHDSLENLHKVAAALHIDRIERHIFLCADQTKAKCCSLEAGLDSWEYLKKRLDAMESEKAAAKILSDVTVEIGKAFEGIEIEPSLMKEIVECACEMNEGTRKKFTSVLSQISPMLIDDAPEDSETAPAKEAVEEEKKPNYRPTAKKPVGYQKGSLLSELGLKK